MREPRHAGVEVENGRGPCPHRQCELPPGIELAQVVQDGDQSRGQEVGLGVRQEPVQDGDLRRLLGLAQRQPLVEGRDEEGLAARRGQRLCHGRGAKAVAVGLHHGGALDGLADLALDQAPILLDGLQVDLQDGAGAVSGRVGRSRAAAGGGGRAFGGHRGRCGASNLGQPQCSGFRGDQRALRPARRQDRGGVDAAVAPAMDYKRRSRVIVVGEPMLTTRPSKRKGTPFSIHDLRFDILDEGRPIGTLIYDKRDQRAAVTLEDKAYTVERATDRPDERLYQALIRVLSAGAKPPANPHALKDAGGRVLGLAERMKKGFAVSRGDESFVFRKPSFFSRPYNLYRAGSDQSLGSVGQKKFFTRTLHIDLQVDFDAAFQVFLLVLLLNLTTEALESSTSATP